MFSSLPLAFPMTTSARKLICTCKCLRNLQPKPHQSKPNSFLSTFRQVSPSSAGSLTPSQWLKSEIWGLSLTFPSLVPPVSNHYKSFQILLKSIHFSGPPLPCAGAGDTSLSSGMGGSLLTGLFRVWFLSNSIPGLCLILTHLHTPASKHFARFLAFLSLLGWNQKSCTRSTMPKVLYPLQSYPPASWPCSAQGETLSVFKNVMLLCPRTFVYPFPLYMELFPPR